MTFDIISVREAREGDWSYYDNLPHNSYWHAERLTVQGLILGAYDLKSLQLPNLPSWAKDKRFNITAKSDDDTDQALAKLSDQDAKAEKQHMVQILLAERFHLRLHPKTRIADVYQLVTTPSVGTRMIPVFKHLDAGWASCTPRFGDGVIDIASKGCPMRVLVSELQANTPDPIVDKTGMTGSYAFHLYWRWSRRGLAVAEQYPEMRDAVREQLGLELKAGKDPVTLYVVDQLEEPTPN